MAEQTYKFHVQMSCNGCVNAVDRVLKKAKENEGNISSYDIDLDSKKVEVTGTIGYDQLYEKLKGTQKAVKAWEG